MFRAFSGKPVPVVDEDYMADAGCAWAPAWALLQRGGKSVGVEKLVEVMAAKHPVHLRFEPEIGADAQALTVLILRAAFAVAEGAPFVSYERGNSELGTAEEDFLPTILHVQTQHIGADQHNIATSRSRNDIRMTFPAGII